MKHIESALQKNCIKWFRLQYPALSKAIFAVPNGGHRNAVEAAIMKAEGIVAGVSDVILLTARGGYHSLCIEFKTEKGRQTDLQKQWQKVAEENDNKYIICRSLEQFQNEINNYLK